MQTRREFIKAAAAGSVLGATSLAAAPNLNDRETGASLNILILGGTGFIGPHMVRRAQERDHRVTLFNRGKTNADLFADVETLIGDRDGQLDALKGRTWDAVIDNSGYVPRHVADSAALLADSVKQYLFISSVSAYADFTSLGLDEDYPVATMPDESVEEVTGETYGPMKALCEQAVHKAMPLAATIFRPGFIVGPGDRSDRWTYWPVRMDKGGQMLAPGSPNDPIQIIDARDLAAFVINALETRVLGTYNVAGPAQMLTMGHMLGTMKSVTGADVSLTWVDAETLEKNNASVPIWAPPAGPYAGLHCVSNARAQAAGLTFTALEQTVADTLAWWKTLDEERRATMRSGLRVSDPDPDAMRPGPLSLAQQMTAEAELLQAIQG